LGKSLQGEGRASTRPEQPFQPSAVVGLDAHRGIEGESAAVIPLGHVLGIIRVEVAVFREPAQDPLPDPGLDPLDVRRGEGGLPEPHRRIAVRRRLEDAVEDDAVKVHLLVEGRSEAVQEAHCPPPRPRRTVRRPGAQRPLDLAQEDRQHRGDRPAVVPQEVPQAPR
jgi:hypothetical protein